MINNPEKFREIKVGDIVDIYFVNGSYSDVEVLYTPNQPFDVYIVKTKHNEIRYIQMFESICLKENE